MPRNEKHYFICQFCDIEFYNPKSAWRKPKYCSKECFYEFQRTNYVKNDCFYCNKPFKVKPWMAKQRFCSPKCRQKGLVDPTKKGEFTCEWCEKDFINWKSRPNRFCSQQCRSEFAARQPKLNARKPKSYIMLICSICQNPYTVHKLYIEQRNSNFCSRACKGKDKSNKMKGENNPNWKGGHEPNYGDNWIHQSKKARKRDDYTCQVCSYRSKIKNLDVHHIKPLRLFNGDYKSANKLNNLICLCRSCHKLIEHGTISCPIPKSS